MNKDIFEAIVKAPPNLIIYGINVNDIKNVYFGENKTIKRLEKYSPDYLQRVKNIINKLEEKFNIRELNQWI